MDHAVVIPVDEPVVFSNLRDWKLNISGCLPREIAENLLAMIQLPVVETLSLVADSHYSTSAFPFEALLPLVTELGTFIYPPLRRLLLTYWDINLVQLVDLLNACPFLEELSLYLAAIEPRLILETISSITLSHLVSFAFAFKAPGHGQIQPIDKNEELQVILGAFSHL
ncbi:hypothetical protein H0H93_000681, partial [Arthromyces matolae]